MLDKAKEKKYIAERAKGKSIRKAAKAARVPVRTAARAEKDPAVKSEMRKALEKAGGTHKKVAEKIVSLMQSKKALAIGSALEFVEDNQAQIAAAKLAASYLEPPKTEQQINHTINLNADSDAEFLAFIGVKSAQKTGSE